MDLATSKDLVVLSHKKQSMERMIMHFDTNILQVQFLEALNHELRQKADLASKIKQNTISDYFPTFLVSGLFSLTAWSLSWIS